MQHDPGVPNYLKELVPSTIGARVGRHLRNENDLTIVKTKKAKYYNSFVPK